MTSKPIHLPGLNGIRAIGASVVALCHITQNLHRFDIEEIFGYSNPIAPYRMALFFVLSGFLFTYLLLNEKEKFQKIDLKRFYLRRILRIWPIYYLTIFFTVILMLLGFLDYGNNTNITLVLYSLLLSNVGYYMGLGIITITPLWSVGVEEQFYVILPILLNKSRNTINGLIGLVGVHLMLKIITYIFFRDSIYKLISMTAFDSMGLGGIGAYLVYTKNKLLFIVYHKLVQIAAWSFLFLSICKPLHLFTLIDQEVHTFFYLLVIINISTNPNTIIRLEDTVSNFLGEISYGIYIYHMPVLFVLSLILKKHLSHFSTIYQVVIVNITVIIGTIIISYLSYTYFESIFLKMKPKYSKIHSNN